MGRDELLAGAPPLHVTNGDVVVATLEATSLPGDAIAWRDVLHEGPLAVDPAESRRVRAAFLAEHSWGDTAEIEVELEQRDARVLSADQLVLWFEHDLYDQLQLIQLLALVGPADSRVELVQADDFLGRLAPADIEALWATRRPVTAEQRALATAAWQVVCTQDVGAIERFAAGDTSALPYVGPALRRLVEEWRPGLSRTQEQLLAALGAGSRTAEQLFIASQDAEEAAFLGDTWCWLRLRDLADAGLVETPGGALPAPPPRGDERAWRKLELALTDAGRALVDA